MSTRTCLKPILLSSAMIAAATLAACSSGSEAQNSANVRTSPSAPMGVDLSDNRYFIDGQETLAARRNVMPITAGGKNVILFLADGMDPTTVAAARIYDGQTRGEAGEENFLSFERLPHLAMAKTYNTDAQTPDSAGTMSAIVTGVKTKMGMISLTDAAERSDCESAKGAIAPSIVELAEASGMATGVISTARLTHATPAATYAHSPDREWERDVSMPEEAVAAGCRDIARQLIEFPYGDGIDFAMGGGRSNFLTVNDADPEDEGRTGDRKDGRNLAAEWQDKSPDHIVVFDQAGFDAIDPQSDARVLGLFERSHMEYELDRSADKAGEPSLEEMTRKAIDLLEARGDNGYALVVEGGRVDHAHHGGNAARALADAQEFSQAVAAAVEMTDQSETLIIVTADHGHTLTFAGYPTKGNNILGLATAHAGDDEHGDGDGFARAADGKTYTTLGYGNGPGSPFFTKGDVTERPSPTQDEATDINYRQQAIVPAPSETHGGQDVTIYASGPGAYLFGGIVEQSYIFHVINDTLNLRERAGQE